MILANPKVELALVASCLTHGLDVTRAAASEIGENDFHELNTRDAWRVISSLIESRDSIDLVSFDTRWRKISAAPNPPVEIYEAVSKASAEIDVTKQIAELREWTRRRSVHAQALKLAAVAANPKADIESAVLECQSTLKQATPKGHSEIDPKRAVELHVADLEYRHSLGDKLSGISTGFTRLDECTDGFQRGELSVFGARPSHGKSAILLGFAHHAAFVMKRPVLFISLEMSVEMLMRRLNAMETGINLGCMKRGKLTEHEFTKITGFNLRMQHAPLWFYNGNTGMNINKIRQLVRRYVEEHGIEMVIIDYLQRVPPCEKHEKRTYEVAEVSSGLQALALELSIHVCTAAQLNREPDKAQGKEKGRMPRICDLADSAQIDRDGDLICLLQRKDMGDEATLVVAKQRDGEYAYQHLWFDKAHCRFVEDTQEMP